MINVRDTDFYRPTSDAVDWSVFGADVPPPEAGVDLEKTRMVGEIVPPGRLIGVYVLAAIDPSHYAIRYLAVAPEFRGQGFGRRLLGHALGLAESKGGRVVDICAPNPRALTVFTRYGFSAGAEEGSLRFELPPE